MPDFLSLLGRGKIR